MTAQALARRLLGGLGVVAAVGAAAAIALWRTLRPLALAVAQVLLALVVVFEEWGWQPLAAALAWFARFRPIALLEAWIASLPPYGALAVFALPVTLLFPLKLVAVWLLANGKVFLAGALFIGAKLASTAFLARIFMLTKPALMQIAWFRRAYAWFVPWEEAALGWLRASWAWRAGRILKARAKRFAMPLRRRLAAAVVAFRDGLRRRWPIVVRQARMVLVRAVVRAQRGMAGARAHVSDRINRNRVL